MTNQRLAEIKKMFGPAFIFASTLPADGTKKLQSAVNELIAEIEQSRDRAEDRSG